MAKKDLKSHFYHKQRNRQQADLIAAWQSGCDLPPNAINQTSRRNIQDLLLVRSIREHFAPELRSSRTLQGVVDRAWEIVWIRQQSLRPRTLQRLENAVISLINIRQHRQSQLQRIHQLRKQKSSTQKADHDMTAKGSGQPQSMSVKGEQLVCREDLRAARGVAVIQ